MAPREPPPARPPVSGCDRLRSGLATAHRRRRAAWTVEATGLALALDDDRALAEDAGPRWKTRGRAAASRRVAAGEARLAHIESGAAEREMMANATPFLERAAELQAAQDAAAAALAAATGKKRKAPSAAPPPRKRAKRATSAAAAAGNGGVGVGDDVAQVHMARDASDDGTLDMRCVEEEALRLARGAESSAPPAVYVVNADRCPRCKSAMVVLPASATMGCPPCKLTRRYVQAASTRAAYGEEVEFSSFSYKKKGHFQDTLNSIQAKESKRVPDDVVRAIGRRLATKPDVTCAADVRCAIVRDAMKEMKKEGGCAINETINTYYDSAMQISSRLSGRPPPRFTPAEEEQLRKMFDIMIQPFLAHKPPERRNYLSYSWVAFKFTELLGWDDMRTVFKMLKGADKRGKTDDLFEKMCGVVDWEFIAEDPRNIPVASKPPTMSAKEAARAVAVFWADDAEE